MAQGLTIGRECHGGDFFSAPVIAPQSQHYTFQPLIDPLLFNDWRWRRFEAFSARKPLQIRDRTTIHPTKQTASIAVRPLISMQQMNGKCVIDETAAMLLLGEWYPGRALT